MDYVQMTHRKKRTKEHFQQALIDLIKEKGFHSVTVKDIVNYAKYNRSTFYTYYYDKYDLAKELLKDKMQELEKSVGEPYQSVREINTAYLNNRYLNIVTYIYKNRNFFELIKYDDTLPNLHTALQQTILKIYQEKFEFKTINNLPVNMDYFRRYMAFGFYGLLVSWITSDFETPIDEFIQEVILLARTHIARVKYLGERKNQGPNTA